MSDPNYSEAKQAMAGVFSRASSTYDRVVTSFFGQLGSALVEYVELESGWEVLDVACGRGATVFPAAAKVGHSGRVIGIDLAPGMIEALGNDVDQQGADNIEVKVADAEAIPYPDDSFDAVLCGFALFMFPDSHGALTEFRRVLRPGGRLGISTFTPIASAGLAWFSELVREALRIPDRDGGPVQFDQPDQLQQALATAGFTEVSIEKESFKVSVPTADHFWEWMWSIGIRGLLEQLDEAASASVQSAARTYLDQELGRPPYEFDADAWLTKAVTA